MRKWLRLKEREGRRGCPQWTGRSGERWPQARVCSRRRQVKVIDPSGPRGWVALGCEHHERMRETGVGLEHSAFGARGEVSAGILVETCP